MSKTNGRTGFKFRGVAVFDFNYSDAKFELRPVIQFRDTKHQSWVFLNFLETVQYIWDRGSIHYFLGLCILLEKVCKKYSIIIIATTALWAISSNE